MIKIIYTIIAVIITTCILNYIPNKSNFPKIYVIPVLTAGLIKYCLGDWDEGYILSVKDLYYWIVIISLSVSITRCNIFEERK